MRALVRMAINEARRAARASIARLRASGETRRPSGAGRESADKGDQDGDPAADRGIFALAMA